MKYRTKIDVWYYMLMASLGVLSVWMVIDSILINRSSALFGAAIPLLMFTGLLIIPLCFNTWYAFEDDALHIHAWFCFDQRIDYKLVTAISDMREPLCSPALSLDRVCIEYFNNGRRFRICVSPKDREKFIAELELKTGRKFKHGQT